MKIISLSNKEGLEKDKIYEAEICSIYSTKFNPMPASKNWGSLSNWEIVTPDIKDVYNIEGLGTYKMDLFVTLAEFRQTQINNLLDETSSK